MAGNKVLKIGGILLAAGGSSRMGKPKQFVELDGKTLLRRAAEATVDSICEPVVAVFGAEGERAEAELAGLPILFIRNEEWRSGMSSSIKAGLTHLLDVEPELDAVVITLCDQPFIDANTIDRLANRFTKTRTSMVAARYAGVAGVPALFSKRMFEALSDLEGDKGARELIRDPNASIETIEIREAAVDIDTREDIDELSLH